MLRRQMLPTMNTTIEGKCQIAPFQHLKARCAFKLAELVETHRIWEECFEPQIAINEAELDEREAMSIGGKVVVKFGAANGSSGRGLTTDEAEQVVQRGSKDRMVSLDWTMPAALIASA